MITQALCTAYKADVLRGLHQPGDQYRIALYAVDAVLSAATEAYTSVGEVGGVGYAPGGQDLQGFTVAVKGASAILDWAEDPVWPVATVTARGALIYNASRMDRAVVVLDFGEDVTSTNGPFRVVFPPATGASAVIRLG